MHEIENKILEELLVAPALFKTGMVDVILEQNIWHLIWNRI